MATISDVLAANAFNLPMRVIDVSDTSRTPGLTEELFTNNVLDSLGNGYPSFTSLFKKSKNPTIPTLENLFKVIDLSDDPEKIDGKENRNRKTALEKFIENFPKDRGRYRELMLEDELFGEKGYNIRERARQIVSVNSQKFSAKATSEGVKKRVFSVNCSSQGCKELNILPI